KYSQPNTAVQVMLTKVDDEMVLKITDTGPGIPPEKISKLFKRFSRVEGEYQLPVGTGLGLYFVDVTIQKHHGRIFVESMLHEGTTFTIKLPLVAIAFDT
ncbi:MAG TPA: ATP-binding protein, partial [Methylophilaceae bacterium]|nr:ATP-binding protein [Methylophilaceae bacterium]